MKTERLLLVLAVGFFILSAAAPQGAFGGGLTISGDNVGIGTTTPTSRLSDTSAGTGTGRAFAVADSSNVERLTVLDNGNVGIGTGGPLYKLHVVGTAGTYNAITSDGTREFGIYNSASGSSIGTVTNHDLTLMTNGAGRVTITTAGNVGISTTSPSSAFSLGSGTGYFAGNVGIGTSIPSERLLVSGGSVGLESAGVYGDAWGQWLKLGQESGRYGVRTTWDSDYAIFGLKDEGGNRKDAVIIWGDDENDSLRFLLNESERMRVTGAGNVGNLVRSEDGNVDRFLPRLKERHPAAAAGDEHRLHAGTAQNRPSGALERAEILADADAQHLLDFGLIRRARHQPAVFEESIAAVEQNRHAATAGARRDGAADGVGERRRDQARSVIRQNHSIASGDRVANLGGERAADLFVERPARLAIDPDHGRRTLDFEKAMRGRNRLLAEDSRDGAWFEAIEAQIGTYALHRLELYRGQGGFPGADTAFERALYRARKDAERELEATAD